MKTINVTWGVNVDYGNEVISLEELECDSMEEWDALNVCEQRERLQAAINLLPERTCMVVESWD